MLNIENLDAWQEFVGWPDTYTIIISEKDFYRKGEPAYIVERINLTTGRDFEDGDHILYVNGEFRGEAYDGYNVSRSKNRRRKRHKGKIYDVSYTQQLENKHFLFLSATFIHTI